MLEPNREGECKAVSEGTATQEPCGWLFPEGHLLCVPVAVSCADSGVDVAPWQLHQLGALRAGLCG